MVTKLQYTYLPSLWTNEHNCSSISFLERWQQRLGDIDAAKQIDVN